jgi:hypothetical protein
MINSARDKPGRPVGSSSAQLNLKTNSNKSRRLQHISLQKNCRFAALAQYYLLGYTQLDHATGSMIADSKYKRRPHMNVSV